MVDGCQPSDAVTSRDGAWSDWTKCSETCGGGEKSRACDNPAPLNGGELCVCDGDDCDGSTERRVCNTNECPQECTKSDTWCTKNIHTYTNIDCDGDGFLDHVCDVAGKSTTVIRSSDLCQKQANADLQTICPPHWKPTCGAVEKKGPCRDTDGCEWQFAPSLSITGKGKGGCVVAGSPKPCVPNCKKSHGKQRQCKRRLGKNVCKYKQAKCKVNLPQHYEKDKSICV